MVNRTFTQELPEFLNRKLIIFCPKCLKPIYGADIDVLKLINSNNRWPVNFVHCHTYNQFPKHALILCIDSDMSVRGQEVSDFIKLEEK